jgi:hypothetical protein
VSNWPAVAFSTGGGWFMTVPNTGFAIELLLENEGLLDVKAHVTE